MKRIALIILLISLAAGAVMGQPVDLQLAVATQALTWNMLQEFNLTDTEIQNILALQEQFRLRKEENNLDLNVIKAQIAQMLYKPDANTAEVNRLLERASDLRLEQEIAQVKAYQGIRREMGEEEWTKLMERTRERIQTRQQTPASTRTNSQTNTRTSTGSDSGSQSGSGSSGSNSSGSGSQSQGTSGTSRR